MPISIDYDSNKNIIYTKAIGLIKLNDILSYFSSVAALNLKEAYSVLADYSDCALELSNEDIHQMTTQRTSVDQDMKQPIKIAVFCSDNPEVLSLISVNFSLTYSAILLT